jgi:hypothetical protein
MKAVRVHRLAPLELMAAVRYYDDERLRIL